MAVNLSLFDGVPTKRSVAIKQFNKLKKEESKRPFSQGRYLVLKKLDKGKYKGNFSTFIFETKPKSKGIKMVRIPKPKKVVRRKR